MRSISIALAVARKELTSEWRTRELVPALSQFVVLALVIANFGFQIDARNASSIAPGILWLALVFAGLVAFGRAVAAGRARAAIAGARVARALRRGACRVRPRVRRGARAGVAGGAADDAGVAGRDLRGEGAGRDAAA